MLSEQEIEYIDTQQDSVKRERMILYEMSRTLNSLLAYADKNGYVEVTLHRERIKELINEARDIMSLLD